jgi:hypothetical protein
MLKSIVFGPVVPFELRIACRSEPPPLSLVLVTEKVDGSQRSSKSRKSGRYDLRFVFARFPPLFRRLVSRIGTLQGNPSLSGS